MTRYQAIVKWGLMIEKLRRGGSFEDIERVRNLAGVIERQIHKLPTEIRPYYEFNPKYKSRKRYSDG